jgi:capsular exopolysaccharide synthesis family protein
VAPLPKLPLKREFVEQAQEEMSGLDSCLVSFSAPESFEAEQYRVLRYLVERLRGEKGRTCLIAVTSPAAGDGKTTTALNLAGTLAQSAETRVLLIDADLRRPAVEERLGKKSANALGLADFIKQSSLTLQDVITRYAALNLSVLPAGHASVSSYEVFKSPRFGALLDEARRQYDHVVIDTPPLVPVSDCRLIEKWVDGFFVVVRAHKTPRKLVQESLAVVEERKILGLVLNDGDPPVFGYDKYYGYASGVEAQRQLRRAS